MDVQRADGFVVQTGDPEGDATGFVDPRTGKVRTVPLEIMVRGDKVPQYGETLEDSGRFREDPALPFNAFGTLAWARDEFDNNSASSQARAPAGRPYACACVCAAPTVFVYWGECAGRSR